jgi:hypothetical protein
MGPIWKARAFFVMLTVAFIGLAYAVARLGALEWSARRDTHVPEGSPETGSATVAA